MPFEKMLDTGISGIRKQDREILGSYVADPHGIVQKNGSGSRIVYPFEYGWTVSTSGMLEGPEAAEEAMEQMREEGYSEAFINLIAHAARNGAALVRFDADLEPEPGFPGFEEDTDEEIAEAGTPAP